MKEKVTPVEGFQTSGEGKEGGMRPRKGPGRLRGR